MKRIALAATMALALAGTAQADWVDYWGFGGGYTQSPELGYGGGTFDMDYGYHIGAMAGWSQSEDLSIAADVLLVESEYEGFSSSLQTVSAMLNGFYTFDTGEFCRPFIGAGAGGVYVRYNGGNQFPAFTGSEWAFGWQAQAGIAFDIDDNNAIVIGYRYQAAEDVSIEGVNNIEYASHNISIGFVFN